MNDKSDDVIEKQIVTKDEYDESSISVLKGTEGVRHRPSMYIGDVGLRGLHHLVFEVIDNSIDEAMAGRCSKADVILYKDGSVSIRDDGAGIPSDIHPEHGVSTLELILTTLHSGGKFNKKAYTISGGLHGVGLSVVCALSEEFYVESVRENNVYFQNYIRGVKTGEIKSRPRNPDEPRGTLIKFRPDQKIFKPQEEEKDEVEEGKNRAKEVEKNVGEDSKKLNELIFDFDLLKERFQDLAYLTQGFTITFKDEREEPLREEIYHYPNGLQEFIQNWVENVDQAAVKKALEEKNKNKKADKLVTTLDEDEDPSKTNKLNGWKIFYAKDIERDVIVEIALTYTDTYETNRVKSFVNNINTKEGGTHISGFKGGLTRCLNIFGSTLHEEKNRKSKRNKSSNKKNGDEFRSLDSEDVHEGLFAVISVKVPNPQFEGQTKTKLGNNEVKGIVQTFFFKEFGSFLEENKEFGRAIIEKAQLRREIREKQREFADKARKESKNLKLPGKLYKSSEKDPRKRELFLVEGASAGGSAIGARDGRFQEILFLKGKILNVEKAAIDQFFKNVEIKSLITAIGGGIGNEFDINSIRYGKVIILTDADVDGRHIATLLLTLFYRFMKPLIDNGKLFIAVPPEFRVEIKSESAAKKIGYKEDNNKFQKVFYCNKEKKEQLEKEFQLKLKPGDWSSTRFKGLGEMDAKQLKETAMHKDTRNIVQITLDKDLKITNNEEELITDASRWIEILMGDDIITRKKFIKEEVFSEEIDETETLIDSNKIQVEINPIENYRGMFYNLAFIEDETEDIELEDFDEIEEEIQY
jgi:DNA gyrase subunit B